MIIIYYYHHSDLPFLVHWIGWRELFQETTLFLSKFVSFHFSDEWEKNTRCKLGPDACHDKFTWEL